VQDPGSRAAKQTRVTSRAGDRTKQRRRRPARRRLRRPRWLRLVIPIAVLGVVGFLYWHPIATYVETRRDLDRREREVALLRTERALLEQRLELSTSLDTLAREARRTGLVRRGEQLFIVKGIPAWREARAADR